MYKSAIEGGKQMNKKLLATIFGSVLMLTGCFGGNGGDDKNAAPTNDEKGGDVVQSEDAEKIVKANCTSCHGGNLEGQGNAPSLKDVGSRLSEAEILDVIHNGRGGMPAHVIEGAQAEVVAEWLSKQK
jgi:cytochrome c551